jgi:hypothetical protein
MQKGVVAVDKIRENIDKDTLQLALQETFNDTNKDIQVSEKDLLAVRKYIVKVMRGSSSFMQLICMGEHCILAATCPFMAKDSNLPSPFGLQCPLDTISAKKIYDAYVEDLQIDEKSRTECSQINDLVEIDMMKYRIAAILGKEGMIIEEIVGIDPNDGTPLKKQSPHPAIQIKDILDTRRARLLRQLQATREARANQLKNDNDPSKIYSKINEILSEYDKSHSVPAEVIEAEVKKKDE